MEQELILKYSGKGVKDGSIDYQVLANGLASLDKVFNAVMRDYFPEEGEISIKIVKLEQGSVKAFLKFFRKNPTLVTNVTGIAIAIIGGVAYYVTHTQLPRDIDPEIGKILNQVIENGERLDEIKKELNSFAPLLRNGDVEAIDLGAENSLQRIMDKSNMDAFVVKEKEEEWKKYDTVNDMKGVLISLNKNTRKGSFFSEDRKKYSISLVMKNYRDYFRYFNDKISISGAAFRSKKTGKVTIKVADIKPAK